MSFDPTNLVWLDKTHCGNCGRGPEFFLTEHHEKKDGKRTGRVTILCRDCHNLADGIISKDIMRGVMQHTVDCKDCYSLLEQIRKHSGYEQKPIHDKIARQQKELGYKPNIG